MHQGTQRVPSNTVTVANIPHMHIRIRNLGIRLASGLRFFVFFLIPRGGHGRRKMLMDFHPYGYGCETSIFTLGVPHEEVQGRRTKLHPVLPWAN